MDSYYSNTSDESVDSDSLVISSSECDSYMPFDISDVDNCEPPDICETDDHFYEGDEIEIPKKLINEYGNLFPKKLINEYDNLFAKQPVIQIITRPIRPEPAYQNIDIRTNFNSVIQEFRQLPDARMLKYHMKVFEDVKKFDRSSLKPVNRTHWIRWFKSFFY